MYRFVFAGVLGIIGYGIGKRIDEDEKKSLTPGTENVISKESAKEVSPGPAPEVVAAPEIKPVNMEEQTE